MKRIYSTLFATILSLSLSACSDYNENFHEGADRPDTISGSTRPNDEDPDTISGSTRPAEGSIVKGRIGTGTIALDGMTYTDAYGIDFNKDGYLEFRIINNGNSLQWEPATSEGDLVQGPAMSNGNIATLQKHSTIGSNLEYSTSILANLPTVSSLPEKFYVGCRFTLSDGIHYGWVKVKYDDGELEWDKCAYNTTPSASITAGDD